MSFDNLTVEHGALGSKSARVTNVPDSIKKLIANAWQHTQEHPEQFHIVRLGSKEERDQFHLFAKAAAKQHTPVLDYRKLPRPAEKDESIAYFTLRELTPDTPRPGRKPGNPGNDEDKAETPDDARELANA